MPPAALPVVASPRASPRRASKYFSQLVSLDLEVEAQRAKRLVLFPPLGEGAEGGGCSHLQSKREPRKE